MTTLRRLAAVVVVVLALPASPAAAAEPDPAEALFNRGVAQMEAGAYEDACPAIEQSYKLDPRPGTLFALADCEAKRGRLATAVTRYDDYLALHATLPADKKSKQGNREKLAREQRALLGPLVPELTLVLPRTAPRGTIVTRDGAVVAESALGVPFAVDPGDHLVTARAPGGAVTELHLKLQRGEHKSLAVEVREAAAAPVAAPPAAPAPDRGPSGRRVGAFVAGGLGLAVVVAGGVTGGLALGRKGVVDANCNVGGVETRCNHDGKVAADSMKTLGLVSTVGFAVGLAGLGTGVVLFVTEPKPQTPASVSAGLLGAGPGGALGGVSGRW
jgi:hypothetical protein